MTTLLKLADTKANKPGMNLMHYVAKVTRSLGVTGEENIWKLSQKLTVSLRPFVFHPQQMEDIDAELLMFPTQLEHIGMGSRYH